MKKAWFLVSVGRQYIKDVLVDGQSHLLIIREETELPGAQVSKPRRARPVDGIWSWLAACSSSLPQFASWVDAVILVFSLENEASFQEVYKIYHQLAAHRPVSEIAFVVVGTQGETRAKHTI